jgi:hypothetical protein
VGIYFGETVVEVQPDRANTKANNKMKSLLILSYPKVLFAFCIYFPGALKRVLLHHTCFMAVKERKTGPIVAF